MGCDREVGSVLLLSEARHRQCALCMHGAPYQACLFGDFSSMDLRAVCTAWHSRYHFELDCHAIGNLGRCFLLASNANYLVYLLQQAPRTRTVRIRIRI